jgi:hypothetical protein
MAFVKTERVAAVEAMEPAGQPRARRLDHDVVVRRHQAEGVAAPIEPVDCLREQP